MLLVFEKLFFRIIFFLLTYPISTSKSSPVAGSTLHTVHCTPHTAQCTLHTEHCKLHTTPLYCILQIYHLTLQTSKNCLCWTQDLHGKLYLDLPKCLILSVLHCSRKPLTIRPPKFEGQWVTQCRVNRIQTMYRKRYISS